MFWSETFNETLWSITNMSLRLNFDRVHDPKTIFLVEGALYYERDTKFQEPKCSQHSYFFKKNSRNCKYNFIIVYILKKGS